MNPSVKQEGEPDGEGGADRYFCPYPGCKRSFAELWRLKVHYRAPPDIRGSGKERGHGTELSHCPKCGKGLKPGKHHVGCSGGKTAPRQAKRAKLAANGGMLPQETMLNDPHAMYGGGMMMQGGYGPGMQGPAMPTSYNQLNAFNQQYQPMQQQYQPDMSNFYSMQNAAQTQQMMVGGLMQQPQLPLQSQPQSGGSFSSPVLGMGLMDTTAAAANGQLGQTGSGDISAQTTQYYHQQQQQQPMQQMMSVQQQPQQPQQLMPPQQPSMQQQPQQQDFLQPPMQQQQQSQQQQPNMDLLNASQQMQQQHSFAMQPQIKQEPLPSMSSVNTTYMPQQPQQQQLAQPRLVGHIPEQGYSMPAQDAAAAGLMPPPPPVSMMQLQQQQPHVHQLSLQQQQPVPQHHHQQQQQPPNASVMPPSSSTVMPPPAPVAPPSQLAANPAAGTISSTLFDEIDNVPAPGVADSAAAAEQAAGAQSRAPSPPPLPPDFPMPTSGMGTLFNFSQFSQKLPASRGPSQQMAMMPRGMEQELPPSMDDLWTPEATYDHHSDGDLMQLLFGAPEQPPTMATIHLHHFLEDDACSSPLLTGLLGGSMDDLKAAEANHVQQDDAAAAAASAAAVHPSPYAGQEHKSMMLPPSAADMQHRQPAVANNNAVLPTKADAGAGPAPCVVTQHGFPPQSCLLPGSNGVINGQYGAAVQVQMHVQMQMRNHSADGVPGLLPIKAEEGCLLQTAGVPSIPEVVASRAT